MKVIQRGQLDFPVDIAQPFFKDAGMIDELDMKIDKPEKSLWTILFRDKIDPALFILKIFESGGKYRDDINADAAKAESDILDSLKEKIAITVGASKEGLSKDLKEQISALIMEIDAGNTRFNELKNEIRPLIMVSKQAREDPDNKAGKWTDFKNAYTKIIMMLAKIDETNQNNKVKTDKIKGMI
jgi:hypothetical protein